MKLHEYQAKTLFRERGIGVPDGVLLTEAAALDERLAQLGGDAWVVKAQVHAGGRGKGGGVRLVSDQRQLRQEVERLLGSRLVTPQTGTEGLPVDQLWIEASTPVRREFYLGMLVDRAREQLLLMASPMGGMDIEQVAAKTPEQILTLHIDPAAGLQGYQCRQVAFFLGLDAEQRKALQPMLMALYRLFLERDASLIEINPLVVTEQGRLLALDAKVNLDDNALYRQPELAQLRDPRQENQREAEAQAHGLNYISLEGNIGCMVNGAGLAMATMDLVKLKGGMPANFLDVGGGTTEARVAEAFKLILSDDAVKAVLVNIFGGIVRCDLIANGIVNAIREVGIQVPVVVRLEGTNAEAGRRILAESGLALQAASDLARAAELAVAAAAQEG